MISKRKAVRAITFGHGGSSSRCLSEAGFLIKFTNLSTALLRLLLFSHIMNLYNALAAAWANELLFTRDDLKSVNWPGFRSGNTEYK